MKRRSLALILAAALLLGAGALAANVGSFTDVDSGAWYADAVKYVTEEGLFNGMPTWTPISGSRGRSPPPA